MKAAPEQYREKHVLFATRGEGNNGFFVIPHPKIARYYFACIISDGVEWEHVSVSLFSQTGTRYDSTKKQPTVQRCPTWEEMCFIKDTFWNEDELVLQFHPPKDQNVSLHNWCLHLWKGTEHVQAAPETYLVGPIPL